ncbi:hypothetical protein CEXT_811821 [Caerostris extrusa]|uniref:Uncharacterized protein n=1 Tax=Caerostris extrusa TaxID=172846 RepID=A0AAV4NMJ4_CAEEX|nr:hypothetical protein CEXT_811821 [Caerostris extrusa]
MDRCNSFLMLKISRLFWFLERFFSDYAGSLDVLAFTQRSLEGHLTEEIHTKLCQRPKIISDEKRLDVEDLHIILELGVWKDYYSGVRLFYSLEVLAVTRRSSPCLCS